jgi:hypothetical protein
LSSAKFDESEAFDFRQKQTLPPWRPDEFVKQIAQNIAQPVLGKIETSLSLWKKVSQPVFLSE